MSLLFQAKILHNEDYIYYDIFRTGERDYIAKLANVDETFQKDSTLPVEITVTKIDGVWKTKGSSDYNICTVLGLEIDMFNNGYGGLLGRIQ